MTDYLYSVSLAKQTTNFLLSLGLGFIIGILYDVFRIVRICISKGKIAFVISDILYFLVLGVLTFSFCLAVNEGELRFYILFGELAGFSIYYFSLGIVVFSISEKIILTIKKVIHKILSIAFTPFKWVFKKIISFFNKSIQKSRKNGHFFKNKSKLLLKLNNKLLYNLNVKKAKSRSEERNV